MYSLDGYGHMIADSERTASYEEALRRAISPDTLVLDIGTGTGVMALMACRFGARQVVAVEPSPLIHVAARIAAENGVADRIRFIQGTSQELVLEERADVIVSDLRGVLPLHPGHIPSIIDARNRLLARDGVLIPARDRIRAAAVEVPVAWDSLVSPWRDRPFDFAMAAAEQAALNDWVRVENSQTRLLGPGEDLLDLDYRMIASPDMDASVTLSIRESGTVHGVLVWFDTDLMDGVRISNDPDGAQHIYGQAFFPLADPAPVEPGSRLDLRLRARLVDGEYAWFWTWKLTGEEKGGHVMVRGDQSSVFHKTPSLAVEEPLGGAFAPVLGREGRVVQSALGMMDGQMSIEGAAARLADEFPGRFADSNEAAVLVRKLLSRYCRNPGDGEP